MSQPQNPTVEQGTSPVVQRVLVVGGGLAGMEAACTLDGIGCEVVLVEAGPGLGGRAGAMGWWDNQTGKAVVGSRAGALEGSSRVEVLTDAEVTGFEGYVGQFTATIRAGEETEKRQVGAVILATGYAPAEADPARPDRVLSLSEAEAAVSNGGLWKRRHHRARSVCFVQGIVNEGHVGLWEATVRQAMTVRRRLAAEATVVCRDAAVAGPGTEQLYRQAREAGVVFFVYHDQTPKVTMNGDQPTVTVADAVLSADASGPPVVTIEPDVLVTEDRVMPSPGTAGVAEMFGVETDAGGFLQKNNVHLIPAANGRRGVFLAGACRGSTGIAEVLSDARAAAQQAWALVGPGEITHEVGRVKVDASRCVLCLTCIRTCPHQAIVVSHYEDKDKHAARIIDAACQTCGICVSECPAHTIEIIDPVKTAALAR